MKPNRNLWKPRINYIIRTNREGNITLYICANTSISSILLPFLSITYFNICDRTKAKQTCCQRFPKHLLSKRWWKNYLSTLVSFLVQSRRRNVCRASKITHYIRALYTSNSLCRYYCKTKVTRKIIADSSSCTPINDTSILKTPSSMTYSFEPK